jgi:hypothetical protein
MILVNWNSSTSERQKLQHSYLVITVVVILLAGIVSLLNFKLGHRMVFVALVAIGAYLTNAIIWNLMQSAVVSKLPSKPRRK